MAIPDRPRLKEALAEFILQNGGAKLAVTPRSVYNGLAEKLHLTKEDLTRERNWDNLWRNEVRWARQELVNEGILLPKDVSGYGVWQMRPDSTLTSVNQAASSPSESRTELDQIETDLGDEGVFSPAGLSDARDIVLRAIVQRRGQQRFRLALLNEYSGCAVTGEKCNAVLEAAHIIPYWGERTNHIQNGLLLRSDIHTLFDLYLLTIDCSYFIRLSPSLLLTDYRSFNGQELRLPCTQLSYPSIEALEQHQSQCDF